MFRNFLCLVREGHAREKLETSFANQKYYTLCFWDKLDGPFLPIHLSHLSYFKLEEKVCHRPVCCSLHMRLRLRMIYGARGSWVITSWEEQRRSTKLLFVVAWPVAI